MASAHGRVAADVELLLRRQDGLLTRRQALHAGMSGAAVGRQLRAGRWQGVLPGVLAAFTGHLTDDQRLRAALLYAEADAPHRTGLNAMLGGPTAAALYGLRNVPASADVHVLVVRERRPAVRDFVVVRRTTRLPPARRQQGWPVAPVEVAVVDACRRIAEPNKVRALVAEAVQTGRTTVDRLAAELASGESAGTLFTRRALAEVQAGARSAPEATVLRAVAASRLPQPVWNTDLLTVAGCWLARPDAWWQAANTVLEIDSREWHLLPAHWERTMRRHEAMTACGLLVVHATPRRIAEDLHGLLAVLARTLEHGRTLPPARVLGRTPTA